MTSNTNSRIRVVIVDDHAVVRTGLRMLIESQPSMKVVGEAGDGNQALDLLQEAEPDIVLLDLDLGNEDGLDLLPEILSHSQETRVILLTGLRDSAIHQRGVLLGAMGLVLKDQAPDVLTKAIQKVHEGEVWLDRSMTADVLTQLSRTRESRRKDPEAIKIASLTEREREVVTLIGEGLKNKQIAERLSISPTTVRHHLTSIFSKLEVSDRLELIIYAYRHGLATPPR